MARYKVGFVTAKHPEIDKGLKIGISEVILALESVNASSTAEAIARAKAKTSLRKLKAELLRRWPNAKMVAVTTQQVGKPRTFGRSFGKSWRIVE